MDVSQAVRDIAQLQGKNQLSSTIHGRDWNMTKTDKFKPICVTMFLYKLVDVPVRHPLGHHRKLCLGHDDTNERQHVWMLKSLPRHKLPTKPLHRSWSTSAIARKKSER